MTEWTAFVGLTGAVLTAFLGLARLSQRLVRGEDEGGESVPGSDADADDRSAGFTAPPAPPLGRDAAGRRVDTAESDRPADEEGERPGEPLADGSTATARDATDAGPARGPPPGSPAHETLQSDGQRSLSAGALLANVALTQGLFGAVLFGGALYFQIPGWALGFGPGRLPSLAAAVGVGAAFGGALWLCNEVASGIAESAGVDYDEELRGMLGPDDAAGWALLLGATLPIIAAVEEFLFRAAAIGATAAGFETSPWALAVVSSAAFALGHGAQGRVGIAVTGVLGLVLAAGFVLTESVVVVVVAHYLVNALEFVVHEGLGYPDPLWTRAR